MKQFKGTKGEWKLPDYQPYGRMQINLNTLRFAVDVWYHSGAEMTQDEALANAKLIASAPDLLKALQELVHLHQCEQEGLSSGQPTPKQWYETVLKAEEAIDKAL